MPNNLTSSHARLASSWIAMALAVPFLALIVAPPCSGQQPTATAVITDLAALPASTAFGVPNQFQLAGTGDVFFTSGGNTGLFRWSQAAGIVRLLQTNDPIEKVNPALPQGLLDATGALLQANAGYAAFIVSAAVKGSEDPGGPVVYDGSGYRGLNVSVSTFSQLLLNAIGRVAVLGRSGYWTTVGPQQIVVETESSGPRGVLVAATGQPAPGTGGGIFGDIPTLVGFNNAGQVAFLAEIGGGNTVRALFLFDGTKVNLVAKSGTAPSDFAFVTATPANYGAQYALNGAGQVAFRTGTFGGGTFGIWIADASGVSRKLMSAGETTGIEGWGNYNQPTLRGFNDAGEVLYDCTLTDGRYALFLKKLDDSAPKVVFSRGQSGGSAGKFNTTLQATMNNAGKVAFLATLSGGSSPIGWYLGSGATAPAPIVAQADSTPLGGSFGLAGRSTPAAINDSNQVLFLADIPDLNAVGLFSWTSEGGVVPVVSSMDSLPDGANTVLRAEPNASSDTETLVRVLKAGGQAAWYAKQFNPDMPEPRKIVAEFDQVPDLGTVVGPGGFSMNSKGEVAFTAALLGSDVYPCDGILVSLPASGVKRSVFAGDSVAGGGTITSFGGPSLNNKTQVAFFANTTDGKTAAQGIFIASDAEGIQAVARQGDDWPGGAGAFNSFPGSIVLNDSGQVAFRGNGPNSAVGLFVGSGGGTPVKVVTTGDPVSTGVTVGGFTNPPPPFKLNAAGQVAYSARLAGGGRYLGVFLGTPGATGYTRQVVALTGDPAPGAGGAVFGSLSEESIDLNSSGQVAFGASVCCSGPASGWYVGSATAPLAPRLLPTQPLPGGGSVRDASPGTRFAALADSGEMAIYVGPVTGGMPQVVIAGADGTLRKFAWNGEKAQDTGSEFGKLYPTLVATPSGRFLFSAVLLNGLAQAGIFVDKP